MFDSCKVNTCVLLKQSVVSLHFSYFSFYAFQKIDAPEYTFTITVVGISVDDGLAELFTDGEGTSTSATEVTVPAELLQQALATNDGYVDLEAACEEGPFRLSISRKGTDILNIAKI
jgi:hypothetical protein